MCNANVPRSQLLAPAAEQEVNLGCSGAGLVRMFAAGEHEHELDGMKTLTKLRQNARRLVGCWCFHLSALDLLDAFTAKSFQPAVSREVIRRAS